MVDGHRVVPALGGLLVVSDGGGREVRAATGAEAVEVVRDWFVDFLENEEAHGPAEFAEAFPGLLDRVRRARDELELPSVVTTVSDLQAFTERVVAATKAACVSSEERAFIEPCTALTFGFLDEVDLLQLGDEVEQRARVAWRHESRRLLTRALAVVAGLVVLALLAWRFL